MICERPEAQLEEVLQTTAEIAAAFAGFASVVVIFRRKDDVYADRGSRVTFQSMVLGSLFVIFFGLLPLVLGPVLDTADDAYALSAAILVFYIVGTFIWGVVQGSGSDSSAIPYFVAAATITVTQLAGLFGLMPTGEMYLIGVFTLLTISGYAFYSLITFAGAGEGDA